jgi:hypothetical protein
VIRPKRVSRIAYSFENSAQLRRCVDRRLDFPYMHPGDCACRPM